MKMLIIILLATLSSFDMEGALPGGHKLTIQEAEKILGEPCQLKEEASAAIDGGHEYKSTYLANSSDEKVKVIALYFNFQSYKDEATAKEIFKGFRVSNQTHEGFKLLTSPGDEAFFQSDNVNFYLIIVRKKNEMLLMKVSKITTKTSLPEFRKIAADIIQRI